MQKGGQKKCGVGMTTEISHFYGLHFRTKEEKCIEIIKTHLKDISKVSIVGTRYPFNYVKGLKDCEFNLIDFHPYFEKWCLENFSFANINIFKMRPMFDDVNYIIADSDLIIFPETEYLLPFEYLKYDLKNKNVMFVNEFFEPNHIKNNFVYSLSDMEEMCDVKSDIKGKLNNTSFYLLKLA